MKFFFTILMFISHVALSATCQFKYESKTATLVNEFKTVDDFVDFGPRRIEKDALSYSLNWCTDHNTWVHAIPDSGTKANIRLLADDSRCGYGWKYIGTVDFGEPIERIESADYNYLTYGRGCKILSGNLKPTNTGSTGVLYMGEISECPGKSKQYPHVDLTINKIVALTPSSCPPGYENTGDGKCKKPIKYKYKVYKCDENDKNSQGFGWVLDTPPQRNGNKLDPNLSVVNDLTGSITSHNSAPLCKRQYQECTIDCPAPLVLDTSTGNCYASYETMCQEKGMTYNANTNTCDKSNQCLYATATKDVNSSYCVMTRNCEVDNTCYTDVIKQCADNNFTYSSIYDQCSKNINCSSSQYVLDDGLCGSTPFCNIGDIYKDTYCVHTEKVNKTCAPYSRSGNVCFVGSNQDANSEVSTFRPLIKTALSGVYKENDFGNTINTLCTDIGNDCQFRLTKLYADNDGKSLCFESALGVTSCINIQGGCTLDGRIENSSGIKQLKVENSNTIQAYNLAENSASIGTITSSCTITGKVGAFSGDDIYKDITSVKGNGTDLVFWDSFERGFIGVISFLPSISDQDLNDGYAYEDGDVYSMLNKGFVGFYSGDTNATYAVYNGFISKTTCQDLIKNTSFFIAQAETESEREILQGLNFKSGDNFSYTDGDLLNGSCVIKSSTQNGFAQQSYAVKKVNIATGNEIFVCSPLTCADHFCQENYCPANYRGDIYDQQYFIDTLAKDFPTATTTEACVANTCDSNKPYFSMCGNNYGCKTNPNIYQQSDGTCVEVVCKDTETLDLETGKCVSFGCVNSVERGGKCYRSLY